MNNLQNLVEQLTEGYPKSMIESIDNILREMKIEYLEARMSHNGLHSPHEGYAVLKEELDELWSEIKKKHPDNDKLLKEATQVGAMAVAFIIELLDLSSVKMIS